MAETARVFRSGPGSAEGFFASLGERRFALITGSRWLEDSGWLARLSARKTWAVRVHVAPNPRLAELAVPLERVRSARVEVVVAVGGGSAMDAAKLLALGCSVSWDGRSLALPGGARTCHLAVVPTTAGTGSEVTPYASFESPEHRKFSFSDPRLVPDEVIHDPLLLLGQPPSLAADAAADALSQAIESLWSKRATAESRARASLALGALLYHAPGSLRTEDPEVKAAMQQAALLSGAAIAVSQTTAVHAVSYPLTARFGISHGRALAVLLPHFLELNGPSLDGDVRALICRASGAGDWGGVIEAVGRVLDALGLPSTLAELGLGREAIPLIVAEGYRPDRMGNNPIIPTAQELTALLERAGGWAG